jgi:hypothetical protein
LLLILKGRLLDIELEQSKDTKSYSIEESDAVLKMQTYIK